MLSLESLESRCLLSITELVSLTSDLGTEPSILAEPAITTTYPLTTSSDTLFADSATQPPFTPQFSTGQLSDVSNSWQTVTLPESYQSMVVVLTPNYDGESLPLVPRMQVVSENSFEVRVDRTDGLAEAVAGVNLHYLVVEEGVYTEAEHGVNMEAVTFTSTVTDHRGSWSGEDREYSNSYESPVVVGQVMSYQDARFSSFWAHDGSRRRAPSSDSLNVGKHAGDDPEPSRDEETLGYVVLEAGNHVIGSTRVLAGTGSDSIQGVSNSPPYSYALDGLTSPSTAILSSAAMDGGDGGRPVLYGADPVTATGLNLVIDEDQARDNERRHTTEQVAYLVFDSANQAPTALTLDNQSVAENTSGAVVGQLQVTDPNEGDTHTFTVSDTRFVVENNLLKLTGTAVLDYETESFVDLTVTVYDSGSPPLSYSQSFNLSVEDVAEGSLSGTVFNDADGDGQQGSAETGLGNWTVYLDANANGQLDSSENSTTSNSNGLYTFDNLAAGDYRVAQVVPDGWEQTTPAVSSQSRIVNGTPTSDFPSVGTVGESGYDFCSGTLISQTFVLTAAHCAEGVGDTSGSFTLEGQTYTTEQVHLHPDWNDSVFGTDAANDIALYELNQAVSGTTPSPIFTGTPQVGDELTLVGFGAGGDGTSGHNGDYGIKRVGTTPIDQVTSTLIHWSFDDNTESNTAPGDSGGPAFLLVDGVYQVAGITSGGDRYDAGIGDNSFDTRVDPYQDWINQIMEGGGTSGGPYHQVTLAVGQTITGLDFGNREQSTGPTDDHANEPGPDATPLTLDTTGFGQDQGILEVAGDRDVFAVALTTTGILQVDLSTSAAEFDPYLRIYDSQGNFVADNDDSGGTLDSSVTIAAAAETYYLQASSYLDNGTGSYSLQADFTADGTTEGSLSGTVFNDADGDGQQGSAETGLGNWTVYLDANANGQLDSSENSTTSNSNGLYTFDNLAAGDYRVAQVVPDGWEQTTPAVSSQSRIVNGTPTSDFPSVGTVGESGYDFCSGTLISQTFVLTAAHCAEGVGDTSGSFTLEGQTYTTEQVHLHPDWNDSVFGTDAANDIALYELNQAVSGTTPSPIFTGTPQVGDELTLVGFGAGGDGTSGHNGDYGIKRVGTTPIDQVTSTLIHWSFDDNTESNTAPGDSGGPAFLLVDGVYQVAGITSGGDRYDAGIGDNSFDTRVDPYQDWINQIMEGGGTSGGPYHQVTLAVGQTITGLDFGNREQSTGPTDDHANEPGPDATPLTLDTTGFGQDQGILEVAGDRDVFAVALTTTGILQVDLSTSAAEFDPYLRIYDSQGNFVADNDDSGGTLDSSVTIAAAAETYYLQASSYLDNGTGSYSLQADFTADVTTEAPQFSTGQLSDVSNSWQTVTLPESYQSMVVVLTPNYDGESLPLVPRMRVVSENSFEVRVDRTDGLAEAVAGVNLHYLVVEEGVYTEAEHGVNMEAVTFTSTVTDHRGSWSGEDREYSNFYESPVVVGQVMSYQDARFSSFWAHDGSRRNAPSSDSLSVGKHAGDDPEPSRDEETLGYVVLEAGNHVIGSTRVLAGTGSDSIQGVSNSPPYSYALDGLTSPSTAILSSAAMDGGDGGRPVLYGADPVTATGLNLVIDEDQARDNERRHTTEQVAYLVFDSANQAPTALTLDNQSVAENTSGAVVGQLQVTDPNEGDTHTFTVSDTRFVVENNLLKLTDTAVLDYETESFVDLTVTVYDSGSPPLSYSQSFNLSVEDVAEGSLSGTVFNDADGDGQQGSAETGLGNWTVYLDANANGQLDSSENSTTSNSNGLYTFDNLAAGDYRVAQVVPDGWEQTTPAVSSQSRIVNGTPTSDFPSVGTVGESGYDFCSGTLISQTFVLTAAHCAEGVGDTSGSFTLEGQTYTTEQVHLHPDWNDSVFGTDAANDIALYELNQAVSGTTPSPIFTGTPQVGDELTLVGFGAGGDGTSGHNGDYGIKRVGTTPIDQVTSTLIHWSFDDNTESNTAPGDSGGPAFLLVDGVYQVAGITSGGDRYDAGIGDNSFDTRVDPYQDWINQIMEGGGTSGGPYHQVTLAVGQTITGLDFGNREQSTGPTDDHANEPGPDATPLTLDTTGFGQDQGILEVAGDRDVFAVALTTTGILQVDLSTSAAEFDPYLRIYDSQGNFVADNDDSGGTLDSSVTIAAAAETYYLQASSYLDNGTGSYSLQADFTADGTTEGSLSGTVFNDADGDGQQGSAETGLGNWTVYLDANANGQLDSSENSTTSNSNGLYTFDNLAAGDYRVAQVVPDGWEQTTPAVSSQSRIVNGTPTSDFPSVGTVGESGYDFCSGTLISQTFVLTAAHCAEGVGDTSGSFTLEGQTYTTEQVHLHPDWNDSVFGTDAANDIALYELNQAVSGTTPSPIFTGTPQVGDELTLVGFGAGGDGTSGHNGDYGIKRVGTTPIDQVTSTLIHWSFDDNTESNTAPGDSGGPAFLLVDGVYQVAGITSGGDRYDAGIGDNSFDTRVDPYQDWINQIMEGGGTSGGPYHQVTLAVGQTITGLDFGNREEEGNPNPGTGYSIEVVFTDNTLTTSQRAVFTTAAQRWGEIIVGDVPAVEVPGIGLVDDLLIYASAPTIDGVGGILGQAAPTSFRESWLPSSGFMEFDGQDLADMESEGVLLDLILHEMGHVIGIGTIWGAKGLLQGAGGSDPRFIGPAATQAYNDIFGNTESSVPVANTGGPGTADAHWREGVFDNELMTGYLDMGGNLLSRVTAGSLADLGYTVNLEAADDYSAPAFSEPGDSMASSAFGEELLYFSRLHPSSNAEMKQTLATIPDGQSGKLPRVPLFMSNGQAAQSVASPETTRAWTSSGNPWDDAISHKRAATANTLLNSFVLPRTRRQSERAVDIALDDLFPDNDWKKLSSGENL